MHLHSLRSASVYSASTKRGEPGSIQIMLTFSFTGWYGSTLPRRSAVVNPLVDELRVIGVEVGYGTISLRFAPAAQPKQPRDLQHAARRAYW